MGCSAVARYVLLTFVACCSSLPLYAQETIEFPSQDSLTITADLYWKDKNDTSRTFICLFHQAGWSRGEYKEIAPKLVELGYNCMAVDARSGRAVNDVINETARRAKEAKRDVGNDFERAYPDIVAALNYARENFATGQLIAWGSSYSASLVLKASSENEGLVDGTLSFAPNDMATWTRDWIVDAHENVKHPVFMTSARREKGKWERLAETFDESQLTKFIPRTQGNHGSRALWDKFRDSDSYWDAVQEFLSTNFPPQGDASANGSPVATRQPVARPATPAGDGARGRPPVRPPVAVAPKAPAPAPTGDANRGDANRGDANRGDANRGDQNRGDADRGDADRGKKKDDG